MIWLQTILYFLASMPILWALMMLYVKILLALHYSRVKLKQILMQLAFIIFAVSFILPIFIVIKLLDDWSSASESYIFLIFFVVCFFLAHLPGFIYFNKRYINRLKASGELRR